MRSIEEHTPDVVIIDITIDSAGNGYDLLRFLRERPVTANIPAVMLTGSSDTFDRAKSLRLGADRFLVKPVRAETLRRVLTEILSTRDNMWWTFTLNAEQVGRLRELFYDETTDLPTLAVVVDDLKKLVDEGEVLQVYCLAIEPLFRVGERDYWSAFDALRREFIRGLRVMAGPILGNDVIVATSHSGANDFFCFVRGERGSLTQTTRNLERVARGSFKSIEVDPMIADEVAIFAGGAVTQRQPLFAPRILYNAVREAKDGAERRETRYF